MIKKRRNGEGSWGKKNINGKEYRRFRSPEGKDFYGKTEKEIRKKYEIWSDSNAVNINSEKITIYEISKMWLKSKEMNVKASTYDGYEYFVDYIINNDKNSIDFGNLQIKAVTEKNIQNYIDGWASFLPKSSIKKNKSLLNQIFKYAKKEKIIKNNLMEEIKIPIDDKIVKKARPIKFLAKEDRLKLEEEEKRVSLGGKRIYGNNAKAIIFLLHTGLRFGELTALEWDDVDFKAKNIFVRNNNPIIRNRDKSIEKKYVLDKTTPKRKSSERHIPLSDKAYVILQYFYENKNNEYKHVFYNDNRSQLARRNVNRTLVTMLKASNCDVQCASPHDLRHSFGSELIKRGVDVKVVSELLGHKDIQTTYNIYIHILSEQKINAIDVFNEDKEV